MSTKIDWTGWTDAQRVAAVAWNAGGPLTPWTSTEQVTSAWIEVAEVYLKGEDGKIGAGSGLHGEGPGHEAAIAEVATIRAEKAAAKTATPLPPSFYERARSVTPPDTGALAAPAMTPDDAGTGDEPAPTDATAPVCYKCNGPIIKSQRRYGVGDGFAHATGEQCVASPPPSPGGERCRACEEYRAEGSIGSAVHSCALGSRFDGASPGGEDVGTPFPDGWISFCSAHRPSQRGCPRCEAGYVPEHDVGTGDEAKPKPDADGFFVPAYAMMMRWQKRYAEKVAEDAKLARMQPFAPGTVTGTRQAWLREAIACAIEGKQAPPFVEEDVGTGDHDRESLGRIVRDVWIAWAREQPSPKPSWLVPWESLAEPDREVDRRIGETIARAAVSRLVADNADLRAGKNCAVLFAEHLEARLEAAERERDEARKCILDCACVSGGDHPEETWEQRVKNVPARIAAYWDKQEQRVCKAKAERDATLADLAAARKKPEPLAIERSKPPDWFAKALGEAMARDRAAQLKVGDLVRIVELRDGGMEMKFELVSDDAKGGA